jgi:hypothetical protein
MAENFTVTFEGLIAMFMETILGDMTQRSLVEECRRFGEACCLSCYIFTMIMAVAGSSQTPVIIYWQRR